MVDPMRSHAREAALAVPVFRWSGAHVGFMVDGWFFSTAGRYLGWYEADSTVWAADGAFIGERVDDHYVLRNLRRVAPVRRTPKVPPVGFPLPNESASRGPRLSRPGWVDALDSIGSVPTAAALVGCWQEGESTLELAADGLFVWSATDRPPLTGRWELRRNLIVTPDEVYAHTAAPAVYQVIDYTGDALTLRRVVIDEHSLPFTLRRSRA
jgi:hypothetical protein